MGEENTNNQDELDVKVKAILSSDLDEAEKVRQLFALGFSRRQLEKELGFPKATVYTTLPVKPEAEPPGGKAVQRTKGQELMKIGAKDMIPPEQALRDIRLQDGEYKLGFVDGMGVLIMAARYNQILAASQAETLTNQLKIMEESRKGSADVAREAAQQTLAGVMPQVLDMVKQASLASSPNPIQTMMTQAMSPLLTQVMGNLMTAFQPKLGQPQPGTQAGQPGQPGAQQSAGQQASKEEVKEAFE